jgi:hypothetical protein
MKITGLKPSAALCIGAGLVVLTPALAPLLRAASKNLAKAALIGGMRTYRMVKTSAIAASESVAEIYKEAREELAEPKP